VDEFGRLPEPVLPETLEAWLEHPLALGLDADEMTGMREWLDQLRGTKKTVARRTDGSLRKRNLPPPPKPIKAKKKKR
jgi:hypothetical protein